MEIETLRLEETVVEAEIAAETEAAETEAAETREISTKVNRIYSNKYSYKQEFMWENKCWGLEEA